MDLTCVPACTGNADTFGRVAHDFSRGYPNGTENRWDEIPISSPPSHESFPAIRGKGFPHQRLGNEMQILEQVTFAQFLDCLESLSVITAAGVAVYGIGTWKRERIGTRRIDLAEQTLGLFYEAREVINGARSALGHAGDSRLVEKCTSECSGDATGSAKVPLIALRLSQRGSELFSRIRALRYRFAAVFGRAAAEPFYGLMKVRDDILSAEDEWLLNQNAVDKTSDKYKARMTELQRVLYSGSSADDPTTQRLTEIVEQVERFCQPVIQGGRRARKSNTDAGLSSTRVS